jgi:hypothetical protein
MSGLFYDSTYFIDSIRMDEGATDNGVTAPSYFFGPSTKYDLIKDSEYTLAFDVGCSNASIIYPSRVDVYLVGTAFPTSDALGYKVASYSLKSTEVFRDFRNQTINVVAKNTGTMVLRFVVWAGNWNVRNVSFSSAAETGYNPDQSVINVPVLNKRNELVTFKVDLYDANNNVFPVSIESDILRFDGGNTVIRGIDNRVDGAIILAPSGGGIVLSGGGSPGTSSIYIGSGTPATASTPIFFGTTGPTSSFSLGDTFVARTSGSTMGIFVSGTVAVNSNNSWLDVRTLIGNDSASLSAYAQEQALQANVTASAQLNASSSALQAAILSASSSLAQKQSQDSASFAFLLTNFSASNQQNLSSASILDSFNKIIKTPTPDASKASSGLYLESSSMGYFNYPQLNWPVYISESGVFRFADSSSYVGGADPYSRMIGFSGGTFVVRTNALYVSSSGFMLMSTGSGVTNVIKLGAVSSFISGGGLYADGAGNFRLGNNSGSSDVVMFDPGNGINIATRRFNVNTVGLYMNSDIGTDIVNTIRLGFRPDIVTSTNGAGFYVDGAGNFRVGTDVTGSDYLQFLVGNALTIRSKDFDLRASTISASVTRSLVLTTSEIALGWPAPARFDPQSLAAGVYFNRAGQFFIGSSSFVNPTDPGNQTGNFLSFGGQILNIRANIFRLAASNIALDSAAGGIFTLGAATGYNTGTGIYMSGSGIFRFGNPSGPLITWDGVDLTVRGNIAVTDGTAVASTTYVQTAATSSTNSSVNTSAIDVTNRGLSTGGNFTGTVSGISASLASRGGTMAWMETFEAMPSTWTDYFTNTNKSLVAGAGYTGGNAVRCSGSVWFVAPDKIPFDPSKLYRMRVRFKVLVNGSPVQGAIYAGVEARAADKTTLVNITGTNSNGNQHYFVVGVTQTVSQGWVEYTAWFKGWAGVGQNSGVAGTGAGTPTNPYNLYNTARYFSPLVIVNYLSSANAVTDIDYMAVDMFDEDSQTRTYTGLNSAGTVQTPIQGPVLPVYTPSANGLYITNTYLGYYNTVSGWTTRLENNGNFLFMGNATNYIQWDGSSFAIRATNYKLSTPTMNLDSTVSGGQILLGSATTLSTGTGFYADGSGSFRVGTGTGITTPTYIQYASGTLTVQGVVKINDTTAYDATAYVDVKQVMANYIAFGPFGYFISNL